MRAITRSLVVGAAVLGLAGAGVGAASAMTWPKPKPHHHKHIQKQVNHQVNKELTKIDTEDNDRIVSNSTIFDFGPQQSHID